MATLSIELDRPHAGQMDVLKARKRFNVVACGRRWGKALALDTPLPTPTGWTTMGSVRVGDRLFDEHGMPCTVTGATDIMHGRACYVVTFSDGTRIVADAEHQWLTWDRKQRKNANRNRVAWNDGRERVGSRVPENDSPQIRTTDDIRQSLQDNHSIPCCQPLVLPDVLFSIDPYVLGTWLGDGSSSSAKVYSNEPETAALLAACGEPARKLTEPYAYGFGVRGGTREQREQSLRARLRRAGLLHNKHIPAEYLRASFSQRLSLVQGLMDTDGYASKDCPGACEFTSINKRLALDAIEVIRSLGIRATMIVGNATIRGRFISKKYRIKFSTDLPVFRLPRKLNVQQSRRRKANRNISHRMIVAVEPIDSVPVRCIQVDSPSSLYLCSHAFIPTHNTAMGVSLLTKKALDGEPVAWFAPTYKLLDEAWERFALIVPPEIAQFNKQDKSIKLNTGGRIDFWTLKQTTRDQSTAGRGRKYRRVFVDEASFAPSLEQDWTQAIRPTLTDLKGDAFFGFTPRGQNYAYRLFRKGEAGEEGWASFSMPTSTNPHIDADEIEAARRDLPRDAFEQEYLAVFLADAANPFGLNAIRACIADLAPGPVRYWGVDLAKSVDFTVAIGLNAAGHVCAFQRWQSDWMNTGKRLQAMLCDAPSLVDSTGVGNPIVEQLQARAPLVGGYTFTGQSKQQLMEGLAWAIQNKAITFPAGEIVNELESFQYEYRPGGVRYSAPDGLHDDCVCALALAVMCRARARPASFRVLSIADRVEVPAGPGEEYTGNNCNAWGDEGWS